ncbi:unnamed protein product [Discula destructiva]
MRKACVLRQLGRCAAAFTPAGSIPWGSNTVAARAELLPLGELRRRAGNGGGFGGAPSKHFSTSPTLQAPWKSTPPLPPSVHPHPHPDSHTPPAFAALATPDQFRAVMRLLPSSVVVCTSVGDSSSPSAPPRGMTMSSFTSLSLHPTPLITFNIATPSRTLDAVAASRAFNIHVLSGDAEGARVADWFRRGNAEDLGVFEAGKMREGCGCEAMQRDGLGVEDEAPLLRGRGVLYGLRCRLLDEEPGRGLITVRDHVVVVAEVVDIVEGRGEHDWDEVFGLAYADRRYRQLGGTMVHED